MYQAFHYFASLHNVYSRHLANSQHKRISQSFAVLKSIKAILPHAKPSLNLFQIISAYSDYILSFHLNSSLSGNTIELVKFSRGWEKQKEPLNGCFWSNWKVMLVPMGKYGIKTKGEMF
jgi:hypothetical protein